VSGKISGGFVVHSSVAKRASKAQRRRYGRRTANGVSERRVLVADRRRFLRVSRRRQEFWVRMRVTHQKEAIRGIFQRRHFRADVLSSRSDTLLQRSAIYSVRLPFKTSSAMATTHHGRFFGFSPAILLALVAGLLVSKAASCNT
jgi:hypothetical protein